MSGTVELDPDGVNLVIRFPYRPDLVAEVKSLPERRFDGANKLWRVPARHVEEVYRRFSRLLFAFAPEVSSLLAGTLGKPAASSGNGRAPKGLAAAPRGAQPDLFAAEGAGAAATAVGAAGGGDPRPALSVSALNLQVQQALKKAFPETFWVVGEVADFDKQGNRAHRFFALVEKVDGDAKPVARVEAVLFERALAQVRQNFARRQIEMELRDGIEVRLLVKVDLYPATGRYQLIVEDVDPEFTLGKLALQREQILRELRERNLADRNRAMGFPVPMLRIGVLTSPDSDGWNDFRKHLEESGVGLAITLVPVQVQGKHLRPTVLAGLRWFAEHADEFDVLCIIRGGGSRTDLAGFDDREVAFAVAQHPLKIVIGIGHQRDQSVLDLIAHSEKTPTAVAEFLVAGVEGERERVRERAALLRELVLEQLASAHKQLDGTGHALHRAVGALLDQADTRLRQSARDLGRAVRQRLKDAGATLSQAALALNSAALLRCLGGRGDLDRRRHRLVHSVQRVLERAAARLDQQTTRQTLLDPRRVLGRGFALLRDARGRVVPEAARVHPAEPLVIQLRDGAVHTVAQSIQIQPKP